MTHQEQPALFRTCIVYNGRPGSARAAQHLSTGVNLLCTTSRARSVFLALVVLLGGTTAGQESKRSLEVRVVNSKTGRPEPGVAIQVLAGGGFGGNTDQDGRFSISRTDGQASRLVFDIKKPGFVPLQVAWDNIRGGAPPKFLANTRSSSSQARPSAGLSRINRGGRLPVRTSGCRFRARDAAEPTSP